MVWGTPFKRLKETSTSDSQIYFAGDADDPHPGQRGGRRGGGANLHDVIRIIYDNICISLTMVHLYCVTQILSRHGFS